MTKTPIKLIEISSLKPHEKTSYQRCKRVLEDLYDAHKFIRPIVVDSVTKVILDGHHRTQVLKNLGFIKIPALLVNYKSRLINVESRRKKIKVSKKQVINSAKLGKLYNYKTTRHSWRYKIPGISVDFKQLR